MNNNYLIDKLTGRWIVQSTNYLRKEYYKSENSFINQVKWTYIKDCSKYFELIAPNLEEHYNLSDIELYQVESCDNSISIHCKHYIILVNRILKPSLIVKLNHKFVFVNKFVVSYESMDHLTIASHNNNMTIVEKIYFLSHNLKVIKSTVQKYDKYIGASFSSEIRISY